MPGRKTAKLTHAELGELAEFRYQIRRFLHFSENAALGEGLEPRQHQALLAIKAMPEGKPCTIGELAKLMFLQHQSTVGLADRLEHRQLVKRTPNPLDGRQVILTLTQHGEDVLTRLSLTHRGELEESAPQLLSALRAIIAGEPLLKQNENR